MKETVKDRKIFLDVLRVISAAAVVMMHAVSGVINGGFDMTGYERRQRAFLSLIDATAWSVPVFLMISGYLLLDPGRRVTWKDAVFRFCKRVFLALVLFGIPYSLLELVGVERAFRMDMIPKAIYNTCIGKSWAHMWYLYLILILYAVTPVLKAFMEKVPFAILCVSLGCLFVFTSLLPFAEAIVGAGTIHALPRQLIYLFYYLLGGVFAMQKKKPGRAWGFGCLLLFGILLLGEMGCRFFLGYALDMAYAFPPTALAAILLFAGCRALEGIRLNGGIQRLVLSFSSLSFGIYLVHPVFLNFFYKFLRVSPMNFRIFIGVPLFFGIAFLGAALITYLLRGIPFLRKYVL